MFALPKGCAPAADAATGPGQRGICFDRDGRIVENGTFKGGGVAQLGEHHVRNVGVEGSIPFSSTILRNPEITTGDGRAASEGGFVRGSACVVPARLRFASLRPPSCGCSAGNRLPLVPLRAPVPTPLHGSGSSGRIGER